MNVRTQFVMASSIALALSLAAGSALANNSTSANGDNAAGFGETGDPGDLSSAFFVSPLPNASFETAPATLDAEIGVHQGADDGPIATVEVFVDAESIGSQACADGCTFADIELAQGVHELMLVADIGYTTSTFVYVDEAVPSEMDDGGDAEAGDDPGCSCSLDDGPSAPRALLALGLLLLIPGLRRKR